MQSGPLQQDLCWRSHCLPPAPWVPAQRFHFTSCAFRLSAMLGAPSIFPQSPLLGKVSQVGIWSLQTKSLCNGGISKEGGKNTRVRLGGKHHCVTQWVGYKQAGSRFILSHNCPFESALGTCFSPSFGQLSWFWVTFWLKKFPNYAKPDNHIHSQPFRLRSLPVESTSNSPWSVRRHTRSMGSILPAKLKKGRPPSECGSLVSWHRPRSG